MRAITAKLISHPLVFRLPAGTSRGILKTKPTWYLVLHHSLTGNTGIGECSIIPNLSMDDSPQLEEKLKQLTHEINEGNIPSLNDYKEWPAIQFALETALNDLAYEQPFSPYPGGFLSSQKNIYINGLIWMGDASFMHSQISEKLQSGFDCIKIKIGAIDFNTELQLLKLIRDKFDSSQIEIRVDANGAFSFEEAMNKLEQLSQFEIHSIEQPIGTNQWKEMASLCANSPIPIALDEELIRIIDSGDKAQMLSFIRPQYIILKPSLIGGVASADEWISIAEKSNIGWWATSALESNIGLNAIAQWVSNKKTTMPQGLGTGKLFTNNIDSPLEIQNGSLVYNKNISWETSIFE
jgi:o-succinylbenzoate synthase